MTAFAQVLISEVGPRDGLHSAARTMPTPAHRAWISALHATGPREPEGGCLVPATVLPQPADTADTVDLVTQALSLPGLTAMALAPNRHAAQAALRAGLHKPSTPLSASAAHSLANVRRTPAQRLAERREIVALRDALAPGVGIEVGLSNAFGCSLQGAVSEDEVIRLAEAAAAAGVAEAGLSDRAGLGRQAWVQRLFTRLRAALGDRAGAAHLHNTRGQGLANCLTALDLGVTSVDVSLGELGGCPYAPGAAGNVVNKDLVYLFEAMGVATGIDLAALLAAREAWRQGLPGEPLYGTLAEAGLPLGFANANGRRPGAPANAGAQA